MQKKWLYKMCFVKNIDLYKNGLYKKVFVQRIVCTQKCVYKICCTNLCLYKNKCVQKHMLYKVTIITVCRYSCTAVTVSIKSGYHMSKQGLLGNFALWPSVTPASPTSPNYWSGAYAWISCGAGIIRRAMGPSRTS